MGKEIASAVARWCHLSEMEVRPVIVALCSRRPGSFEWFTRNFDGITQTTTDYRELVANPEVEAVYCAVPHHLHARMYLDAIAAGKHLLGEKPFGIDRPANAAIVQAAREHPELVVRSSSQFPFFPGVQRIVEFIREERFGTILEVECTFQHSSDLNPDKPINWKRLVATNGEYGVMGDLGLHVLHVPLRAGWVPRNVRAVLSNVMPRRKDSSGTWVPCETWDNATLLCEVPQGESTFPLTAKMQRISPGETNTWSLSIKGTRFSARFSTKFPRTLETLAYEPGGPQRWEREDLGCRSVYETISGGIFEFGFSDAVLQMLAAFCDQVARGNQARLPFGCATPEETRLSHEIFTAALESHRTQQVVAL